MNHNVSTSFCSSQSILSPFGEERCVTTLKTAAKETIVSSDLLSKIQLLFNNQFFFSGVCDLYCRIGSKLKPSGRVKDGTKCYGSQKNTCIQGKCRVSEKTTGNFALRRRHKGV